MQEPVISVGIVTQRESITINLRGTFSVNKEEVISGKKYTVISKDRKIILKDDKNITREFKELLLEAKDLEKCQFDVENVTIGIAFHWEQAEVETFQGHCKIIQRDGKLTLINVIPIELYLHSVISSEMNPHSPFEYLKAHSIISRSWLLAQLSIAKKWKEHPETQKRPEKGSPVKWYDREDHEDFDVCADDHCQRYHGITKISDNKSSKAVRKTAGLVLKFNNEICDTRYSKCCGGFTEEFQNVWQNEYFPYLESIIDGRDKNKHFPRSEEEAVKFILSEPEAFCNTKDEKLLKTVLVNFDQRTTDFFRWEINIKQLALKTLLKIKLGIDFGDILDLIPLERGKSGRIIKLKIIGTSGELTIGKELEIRRALSEKHLYSSAFVVEKVYNGDNKIPSSFTLKGAGWGHGVGFCQIGGAVMANEGYEYEEILYHYFPGAKLEKIY